MADSGLCLATGAFQNGMASSRGCEYLVPQRVQAEAKCPLLEGVLSTSEGAAREDTGPGQRTGQSDVGAAWPFWDVSKQESLFPYHVQTHGAEVIVNGYVS